MPLVVFEDFIVRPISKLYRLSEPLNEMPVANSNDNRYNDYEMNGIEAMNINNSGCNRRSGPNAMDIPDPDPMSLPEPQSNSIPWPVTNEVIRYYHQDHLGSTRVITDESRNIIKRFNYYPFGEEIIADTSNKGQYKFTGKQRDQETGLDYFGARYYSSKLYRWMQVDPIKFKANRITNPQRWNLYVYCLNNPINTFDPDGTEEKPSVVIFLKAPRKDLGEKGNEIFEKSVKLYQK